MEKINLVVSSLRIFADHNNENCASSNFFGIPHWAKNLHFDGDCTIIDFSLGDVWVVVANIVVILMRIGAMLAILFVIYGGFTYITSKGEPEKLKHAINIITNAIIGIILTIFASTIVSFIAGRF
jgi:hypothetical protein